MLQQLSVPGLRNDQVPCTGDFDLPALGVPTECLDDLFVQASNRLDFCNDEEVLPYNGKSNESQRSARLRM